MRSISPAEAGEIEVPLSRAVEHDGTIYVSGQVPFDMATGEVVGEDITEQTEQTLENVKTVLEAAGASLDDVLKTTVFLTNVEHFSEMNEVYGQYFAEPYPARSAIEVSDLAADIFVEIEAIAALE